jgi:putative membrane protein
MMWNDGYGMMWSGGWGLGVVHMLLSVIVLVLFVALVASLFTHGVPGRDPRARSAGLAILEERYARGEIDRDEYLQKKRDLLG